MGLILGGFLGSGALFSFTVVLTEVKTYIKTTVYRTVGQYESSKNGEMQIQCCTYIPDLAKYFCG